jgi:hypothetical protein
LEIIVEVLMRAGFVRDSIAGSAVAGRFGEAHLTPVLMA